MSTVSDAARGLRALIGGLSWYKVNDWSSSASDQYTDRSRVYNQDLADVVSSQRIDPAGWLSSRHAVVLDIDHPTYLVKSSTPGHYHLYIDVPGGVEHMAYMSLLNSLANAGVIEQGYVKASQKRGFTCVRMPWVKKQPEQR